MNHACLALALASLLGGCAITPEGKGFKLIDKMEYAKALPYMEKAAQQQSKMGAMMAGWLYLYDYQIPLDLEKARSYHAMALKLPYGPYDQYLDYYTPQLGALIQLNDDDPSNDTAALGIFRESRYSRLAPSLLVLARAYSFGVGVEKDTGVSKLLFERAIKYDTNSFSRHAYA